MCECFEIQREKDVTSRLKKFPQNFLPWSQVAQGNGN